MLHGVTIGGSKTGTPKIGNKVSISAGALIIGGIHIGDNAIIGAGAVVTKDVARGSVIVSLPAKPISSHSDEINEIQ